MKTLMFKRLAIVFMLALFAAISCQNETNENATGTTADTTTMRNNESQASITPQVPSLPYTAVFNEEIERLEAKSNTDFDRTKLNLDSLALLLTLNYPEIKLVLDRVSNDTVYIEINNAEYLTQQMGSSGSMMYLMEATYAFTELPSVRVVNFNFPEGDHAMPGPYSRQSFEEIRRR